MLLMLLGLQWLQSMLMYKVCAIISHGTCICHVIGRICHLSIFYILEPPYFRVTPPDNVSVRYNNAITLNCSSGGVPLPNITWFKDGIVIPTNQYTGSNQSDTLITMLTVVGSLTSHGYYTCQAVNDLVERRVINTTVNVTVFGKHMQSLMFLIPY